jgi:hypothetical protein
MLTLVARGGLTRAAEEVTDKVQLGAGFPCGGPPGGAGAPMPRSDRIRASAPTLICSSRISWHDCGARIDFDRRRVGVRRAFSDVGGRVVLGTPKSHQSRTVPLPRFLAAEFAAAVVGKDADQLVFTMPGGGVMRMPNWRRAVFLSARRRASLSDRFRVHDLRHTAASLSFQAG